MTDQGEQKDPHPWSKASQGCIPMEITYDAEKRAPILATRGLDASR